MSLNQIKYQARRTCEQCVACLIALFAMAATSLVFSYKELIKQHILSAVGLLIVAILFLGVAVYLGWLLRGLKKDLQELEELEDQELEELKKSYALEFERQLKLLGYDRSGSRQKN